MHELELQKREIEVLKICQHPNIIRLLDVFENPEYIYIGKYLSFNNVYSFGIYGRRRSFLLFRKERI